MPHVRRFGFGVFTLLFAVVIGSAQTDPFGDSFQRTKIDLPVVPPDAAPKLKAAPKDQAAKLSPTTRMMLQYVELKAVLSPAKARRGQVVTLIIDGTTKPYAYSYSAVKRHPTQSGLQPKIRIEGVTWLTPLMPIREDKTDEKISADETSYIVHDRFQWQQDFYVSPDAPVGPATATVVVNLQVCTKKNAEAKTVDSCLPPGEYIPIEVALTIEDAPAIAPPADLADRLQKLATPPPTPAASTPPSPASEYSSLGGLLTGAVIGAVLMLLTPCVFPMIPITVNYFIKQSEKEHHRPFFMASVYAGTIIALLTLVILLVGKSIINLANEPWFNLGLGIVLLLFALGLFGLFEVDLSKFFGTVLLIGIGYAISLAAKAFIPFFQVGNKDLFLAILSIGLAVPVTMLLGQLLRRGEALLGFEESSLLGFFAQQEMKGGILGAVFMALTFTITSFSCTGPFLGILLAPLAGATFSRTHLLLAALVYSTTFAAPFFLLALFPTYLKKLPKSGGWMTTIKVTMGFLEVGAALKFLANVDLFWFPGDPRIFNYDTVLCSWIALSLACSLYLFGFFHLHHDTPTDHIGVVRMLFASIFLGMAVYLTPLLFGHTPRGLIMEAAVAFLPPDLAHHEPIPWIRDNYEAAWKEAVAEKKMLFIDFTGQNCANCRANERNAFRDADVVRAAKAYVPLQLFTDSVPDKNLTPSAAKAQALMQQEWQFGLTNDVTNPLYLIFEPDPREPFANGLPKGRIVNKFEGLISDVRGFAKMLENPGATR